MDYYLDTCAILKFVKPEEESAALRAWRQALPDDAELITSELSRLELSRALHRAGVDRTQVPYYTEQALTGLWTTLLSRAAFRRAVSYEIPELGSLDAIHLATAEHLRKGLAAFVRYDKELAAAARQRDIEVLSPA
jgi:uncharacterized protein